MKDSKLVARVRRDVVAEVSDLFRWGHAAQVQQWTRVGVKKNAAQCKERRRLARKLIAAAVRAVKTASVR